MISIYVGNLPYDTTEDQLVEIFKPHGEVHRASLVTDRETHRPRGFGFIEMPNPAEAAKAIEALGGTDFNGRPLTVNEARRNANRNSANLSRSARSTDTPGGGAVTEDPGSTGYSGKPTPDTVETQNATAQAPGDAGAASISHPEHLPSDSTPDSTSDNNNNNNNNNNHTPSGYRNDMHLP